MASCLELFCCCWFSKTPQSTINTQRNSRQAKKKKKNPQLKPTRIISKYKAQQTVQISKQQMKKGTFAYTCPICTLYFNKILACTGCQNNMCRNCVQSYEKKFQHSSANMKCPFCNSQSSNFIDYENEARSYFDTTGKNGFLDPIERKKIDQQMKRKGDKYQDNQNNRSPNNLQSIEQQATINQFPTQNNISNVYQYQQIILSRRQILDSDQINNTSLIRRHQSPSTIQNQRFQAQISNSQLNPNRIQQNVRQINQNNSNNIQNRYQEVNNINSNDDEQYINQFEIRSPQQINRQQI